MYSNTQSQLQKPTVIVLNTNSFVLIYQYVQKAAY